MYIHVTFASASGQRTTILIDASETLERALYVAESQMSESLIGRRVQLPGHARPLDYAATLASLGVRDGATLYVDVAWRSTAGNQPRNPPQPTPGDSTLIDEQIRRLFGSSAAPVATHPIQPVVFDPDDPELQRRAYEAIQQQQIEENWLRAMEETPEAFGAVIMLYVQSTVNNVPVAAFIDSGAQMTIMSARIAEQCNLTRLIDRRFQGVALGVGSSRIIGRIHMAQVRLGDIDDKDSCVYLPMSISVVEQDSMDFLIGLDQLRSHRMCIDLQQNCLRLPDANRSFPFLAEHQLPNRARSAPTVQEAGATTVEHEQQQRRHEEHQEITLSDTQAAVLQHLSGRFPLASRDTLVAALVTGEWDLDTAAAILESTS